MSRRRYTDKEKARIIREFEQHDGSAADFCRRHEVSYQSFMNWRRRAEGSHPGSDAAPRPSEFLEFELGAAHNRQAFAATIVELEFGGGMVLRICPPRPPQP